ncbi:MAG TPA: ATP-binding protein, partial [Candidatus Baltobacteraceae bacterium]
ASLLDAMMGIVSFRYSAGWYIGKMFSVVSSGLLVSVFAFEITRLYQRLTVAQSELLDARDAALDGARAKMEFLATMSHEIRTPINAIIGMNELLSMTPLDEEQREFASIVHASADVLLSVVNQVLDFSKLEGGKLQLDSIEFDPRALIEAAGDMIAAQAQAKGVAVAVFVDVSMPQRVRGDEVRIRQALLNLLSNAAKFTDSGSILLRGELESAGAEHDILHFSVRDTGIGISPDACARLFSPFMQADSSMSRRFGGTGLGLSITKRVVDAMNGSIWVESRVGAGSTFSFTIRTERAQTVYPPPKLVERIDSRVLVVAAEPVVGEAIGGYVRACGALTHVASDLLSPAREGRAFDIVILDCADRNDEETRACAMQARELFPACTNMIGLIRNDMHVERSTAQAFSALLRAPAHHQALMAALRPQAPSQGGLAPQESQRGVPGQAPRTGPEETLRALPG